MVEGGSGDPPGALPYLAMPPWVHPSYHAGSQDARARQRLEQKSAMGSKKTLRNSQTKVEVNLRQTIWLLARLFGPCCKNHLVSKAPDYLALSNPCKILSRVGTLP